MSTYLVDDKTINKVVSYLYAKANGPDAAIFGPILTKMDFALSNPSDIERLANAMFDLNVYAINEKYGEGEAEKLEKLTRRLDFKYLFTPATQIEAIKALECWKYQCTEGDISMSLLYQAMVEVHSRLCIEFIHQLEEYEAAPWG